MNKQYAYGPWMPVKDIVKTNRNIQVKIGKRQTLSPAGMPSTYFDLNRPDLLYREVHKFDPSWTLNTSGKEPEIIDASERNFELYFNNGSIASPSNLTAWDWTIADGEIYDHWSILAWRRIHAKLQEKVYSQEFEFVCNENTIVTGILSKDGAEALLKLHEDCQKQCQLLGVPYEVEHELIIVGKEFSYNLGNYFEFQKLGIELFVDNKVKVEA